MSSSAQILPAGAGYGVVIGAGFFFAFVSFVLHRFSECTRADTHHR